MSFATDQLLAALHYDEEAHTAALAASTRGLEAVAGALHDAFGPDEIVALSEVTILDPPDQREPGRETLALSAQARVFGSRRSLRVEIEVVTGQVRSLLVLVPLPANGWHLSTGWPALAGDNDVVITGGFIVISAGLAQLDESRTARDHLVDLLDVPLRDGLQLLGTGLTRKSFANLWDAADGASLPAEMAPDRHTRPTFVLVRADQRALQLDAWWHVVGTMPALAGVTLTSRGVGMQIALADEGAPVWSWLLEVKLPRGTEVVLRAVALPGAPLVWEAELPQPVPFLAGGEGAAALLGPLAPLLPGGLPAALDLALLRYSLTGMMSVALAARDTGGAPYQLSLDPLALRDCVLRLDRAAAGAPWQFEIDGVVAIFGVDFRATYSPGVLLAGALVSPDGIRVGALLERAVGVELPFNLDTLTIHDAWVRMRLQLGLHSFGVLLDGAVELLPGALRLDSIAVEVEEVAGEGVEYALSATLTLGPVTLRVRAEHDPTAGWTLFGSASDDEAVSLKALVDHLVKSLGVAVPDEVPDVRISSLALSYQTRDGILSLRGSTTWSFADAVPVVAGDHDVQLVLSLGPDRARGGRAAALSLQFRLDRGGRSFDVAADIARTGRRVAIELDARTRPLGLDDALSALGLPARSPGAGLFGDLFQLSTLALTWQSPGEAIDLAFSRPLGDGDLLVELDTATRSFDASWIPRRADATIGLGDVLKVTGAGSALTDVTSVLGGGGLDDVVHEVTSLLTFRQLGLHVTGGAQRGLQLLARPAGNTVDACFVSLPPGGGLVAGASFHPGAKLEVLPFVPAAARAVLRDLSHVVEFEPTQVLLSTAPQANVLPPAFSDAALVPTCQRTGTVPTSRPFGARPLRSGKGLSVAGKARFGDDSVVRKQLELTEIDGVIALGTDVSLQASLGGTLRLDGGPDGKLAISDPTLSLRAGTGGPGFEVGGTLNLVLFGEHMSVGGSFGINETAMTARMRLDQLPPIVLPALPGVRFLADAQQPFWLEVAAQSVPEGLDMGLQGRFSIAAKAPGKYEGDVTIVLEMVEEVPNPLYVKLDIHEMDSYGLAEAVTGVEAGLQQAEAAAEAARARGIAAPAAAVANSAAEAEKLLGHIQSTLSAVSFDHVSMYWADSIVPLPDGTFASPGAGVRGRAKVFGWHGWAQLDIAAGAPPALTGDVELEPLDLGGVLQLKGDGKGMRAAPLAGEEAKPDAPVAAGAGDQGWFIKPGGPVLHVSTRQAPFLHASLHGTLFGLAHADVTADVTEKGLEFDLRTGIADAVELSLRCTVDAANGLDAHGSLRRRLVGEIGPILPGVEATRFHLDTGLEGEIDLTVTAERFRCAVRASFWFLGMHLTVPELAIEVRFDSLAALAELIWQHIRDAAEEIFADVLLPVGKAFEEAVAAVKAAQAAVAGAVEDVATNAAATVSAISSEVKAAIGAAGEAMQHAADSLKQAATQIWDGAAAAATEAARDIVASADHIAQGAIQIANDAKAAVAAVEHAVAAEVEKIASAVADFCARALDAAKDTLAQAVAAVSHILADAAALADKVAQAAAETVAEIERLTRDVERDIEALASEIAHLLARLADTVAHLFTSWI